MSHMKPQLSNIPHENGNPTDGKKHQQSQDNKTQVKPVLMRRVGPEAGGRAGLVVGLGRILAQVDFGVLLALVCRLQGKPFVALGLNLQGETKG